VKTVKFFYEHVFPHCIHPRIEKLLEAAWYIEDEYGTASDGPRYPRIYREILHASGGLDTSALERTIHEVGGQVDDPCHLFIPPWLDLLLTRAAISRETLVTSAKNMGGFEPFKS